TRERLRRAVQRPQGVPEPFSSASFLEELESECGRRLYPWTAAIERDPVRARPRQGGVTGEVAGRDEAHVDGLERRTRRREGQLELGDLGGPQPLGIDECDVHLIGPDRAGVEVELDGVATGG